MPSSPSTQLAIEHAIISSTEITNFQSQQLSWSMPSGDKLDDSFLQALVGASSTKLKSREQKLPKLTNSSSTGASMSEAHCNVDVS